MERYIPKAALVAEIERRRDLHYKYYMKNGAGSIAECKYDEDRDILSFIDTLEVKDPYEQVIQYPSIKDGIKAYAEDYSFNIESELFNQLTKEQQALWRKEIEQACISGGYSGFNLAKDPRYKENLEVKEVDLEKAIDDYIYTHDGRKRMALELDWKCCNLTLKGGDEIIKFAKHFFELGIKASNTLTWEDINSIDHLLFDIKEDYDNGKLDKEKYYKEVLKKFKAQL